MGIQVKTKKWGNSIGVVIPKEIVERLNIKPDQLLDLSLSKKSKVLKEIFGAMKFKESAEQILREVRRDLGGRGDK